MREPVSACALFVFLSFPQIQGCAFKDSTQIQSPNSAGSTPTATFTAAAIPQASIMEGSLSLGHVNSAGKFDQDNQRGIPGGNLNPSIILDTPLPLPDPIPTAFEVKVILPQFKSENLERIDAVGKLSQKGGAESPLSVDHLRQDEDSDPGNPAWLFTVSGLSSIVSSSEESVGYLKLLLYTANSKGDPAGTLIAPLITPPSKLSAEQMTRSDFESRYSNATQGYQTYIDLGQRLELTQVVQIKNSSSRSVILNLPIQPSGSLTSKFQTFSVNEQECSYSIGSSGLEDSLATALYYLPMTEDVSGDFSRYINSKLKTGRIEISIQSGDVARIGIYAQGDKVVQLLSDTYPRTSLTSKSVVSRCKSRCPNPNQAFFAKYWIDHGWAGASKDCNDNSHCVSWPGPWEAGMNDDACNRCRAWDLANNHAWRDPHENSAESYWTQCQGNSPPTYGWIVDKSYETVSIGTQSEPVFLNLPEDSRKVLARFDLGVSKEVNPARTLLSLIQGQTQQHN